MNKKLLKLLSALIAVVMVLTLSSVVLAEDASEADDDVSTVGATAVEEDGDEAVDNDEDTAEESADESVAESAEESVSDDAETAEEDTESSSSGTSSNFFTEHLPRWIALFIIIALIVAAIILAKTNTKLGQRIAKFFKDYKSEIQKISWSSWKDTVKATGVVLVILIGMALAIGVLDFIFSQAILGLASLF